MNLAPESGSSRRSHLQVRAPAKLNLTLGVLGRRDDGYHELESVFARIGIYDDLAAEVIAEWEPSLRGADELVIEPGGSGAPQGGHVAGPDDLVLRAARSLRRHAGRELPRLRFRLTKRIPTAAGMGGGSSDGAAALLLGALAWDLELDAVGLSRMALRLGSDVPFFSSALPVALVRGRGETVATLGSPAAPLGVVTVTPRWPVHTDQVFAAYGQLRGIGPSTARRATATLADLAATGAEPAAIVALAPELREANDLWPAALKVQPSLARARDDLEQALGVPALMSGSGPTLAALYPSPSDAAGAAARLEATAPPSLDGAAIHVAELPAGG